MDMLAPIVLFGLAMIVQPRSAYSERVAATLAALHTMDAIPTPDDWWTSPDDMEDVA